MGSNWINPASMAVSRSALRPVTGAAVRVSVVSSIGYCAFLAGPPLLGWLGDAVGTLEALLLVAALMGPALLTVLAARPEPVVPPERVGR